jgi:hypothetical protein
MGYKAASIFVNEREPGYFGTLPAHNPEKARQICRSLGLAFSSAMPSTFEDGLWPPPGTFALGAYDGGMILADQDALGDCTIEGNNPLLLKTQQLYPNAAFLCVTLHSVVDHWGYALYEKSRLVRRFVGDADEGIVFDEGHLQPEEKPLFERSRATEPGRRIFEMDFNGVIEKSPEHCVGEQLVFLMAARFFGQPLDRSKPVDFFDLRLEVFTKPTPFSSALNVLTSRSTPTIGSPSQKPWWKFW